jgi:hypothetical protein
MKVTFIFTIVFGTVIRNEKLFVRMSPVGEDRSGAALHDFLELASCCANKDTFAPLDSCRKRIQERNTIIMSYRRSGSGRTTGRPETDEGYLAPPSRAGGMNLYDSVTRQELTSGGKNSSASRQKSSNEKNSASSAQKTAARLPYQGHQARGDEEFGTEDDMMPRKPTGVPNLPSQPYAARQPRASNAASLKQSDPSSSYRSSRQANESAAHGVTRTNPPQQRGAPHASVSRGKKNFMMQEDETTLGDGSSGQGGQVLQPGAFRVGGPAIEDDSMMPVEDQSMMTQASELQNLETGEPYDDLIDADIVDPAEQERRLAERRATEKKNAPLAGFAEERPWYKRPVIIGAGILLIIAIVVVVAVLVLTSNKDSGAGALSPSSSPTSSPAPTALAHITLVVQLDSDPWQTGWKLTCDGETIDVSPPGTYGLVVGRPNFRVEREFEVTLGAECHLSLLDVAGNGLNPGLFEIYNGIDIGDQSTRITGGSIYGSNNTFEFMVGASSGGSLPDSSSPPPTSSAVMNSTATCTVCLDGQPVLFPEVGTVGSVTCQELERLASSITNETECKKIQDDAAMQCGCRNHCTTICPDGVSGPDVANFESVVFVKNDRIVTCAEFQDQVTSSFSNSVDECLAANFLGEDVCGCPPTEAFCRICEPVGENSTSTNPSPEDLEKEIVPGVSCRDITGIAYTLKRDDPSGDFQRLCPACLAIGAYCGCGIPEDGRKFCRLCGGSADLLPEPSRIVYSPLLGYNTTCYDIEFRSNINSNSTLPCEVYQQESSLACCSHSATDP